MDSLRGYRSSAWLLGLGTQFMLLRHLTLIFCFFAAFYVIDQQVLTAQDFASVSPLPAGFLSDPGCETCLGLGIVPDPKAKPYVIVEDFKPKIRGRAADPATQNPFPGKFCPECMKADLDEARLEYYKSDQADPDPLHREFEGAAGKLVRVHTRYVTIHTHLPPVEAHRVGLVVETLAAHLQKKCGSMKLTPMNSTDYDSVSMIGHAPYLQFLKYYEEKHPRVLAGRNWRLLPELSGTTRNRVSFFHEKPEHNRHPIHNTVFQLGRFITTTFTNYQAPVWATEGFGAYCEYTALRQNRCKTIAYDIKDMTLRGNWVQNAKKLLVRDELTAWHSLDRRELRGYNPSDYLSAFVAVYFLMDEYPKEYVDYLEDIANGTPSKDAFKSVFGKDFEELDKERLRWLRKRRG